MNIIEKIYLYKIKLSQKALLKLSKYADLNSSIEPKIIPELGNNFEAEEELVKYQLMQRGGLEFKSGDRKEWYKILSKGRELQDFINLGLYAPYFVLDDSFIFQILLNAIIAFVCFLGGVYLHK